MTDAEQLSKTTGPALLWERFHRRLVILAMRRIGNRADAEDIAQEVLQRVTKALGEHRVRDMEALPGFVFETAKHVCLQWLRKRGRENRALETYSHQPEETHTAPQPLTDLIDEERRGEVREALQTLAADDRQLLQQLYALDADPSELAQQLQITPGALRVRKHRILKRLSALLGGSDVTE